MVSKRVQHDVLILLLIQIDSGCVGNSGYETSIYGASVFITRKCSDDKAVLISLCRPRLNWPESLWQQHYTLKEMSKLLHITRSNLKWYANWEYLELQ